MKEDKEVLQKAIVLAEKEALQDVRDNSLSLRPRIVLAKIYISYYRITKDNYYLYLAETVLSEAIKISPENQQLYWLLSDVKYKQGNFDENVELLEKAISLEPTFNDSYWYLVSSYVMEGQYEEALGVVRRIEEKGLGWKNRIDRFQYVISIYEALKDYGTVSSLYKELLVFFPDNSDLWFKLAISLLNAGDEEGSKEAAQKAVQINPALINQVEDALKLLLQ